MTKEESTYKDAGIDVETADKFKKDISHLIQSTHNKKIIETKGFASLTKLPFLEGYYLATSIDGVGTKPIVASMAKQWDMLGYDAVAANVNDLVVYGGVKPFLFLDYFAVCQHKTDLDKIDLKGIIRGMAIACYIAGCSIVGGETAELPGIIEKDKVDVVGTAIGMLSLDRMVGQIKNIEGRLEWSPYNINPGDAIIGLPSSGIHCNGYSLARKVFFDDLKFDIHSWVPEFCCHVWQELLKPTKIYSNIINQLIDEFGTASKVTYIWANNGWELNYKPKQGIKGIAHITGSGFKKILKVIPEENGIVIDKKSWPILPIFKYIQEKGNISEEEMFKTFNMGIGMVLIAEESLTEKIIETLKEKNEQAYLIGHITSEKNPKKDFIWENM